MFPSLEQKLKRFEELEKSLQDPEVLGNTSRLVEVQREYGGLRKVAESVRKFHRLEAEIASAKQMVDEEIDPETRAYAAEELAGLRAKFEELEQELEDLATAGDSITRGGLMMEIRAGTGGEEAALFAGDLFRMYTHFAE